MKIFRVTRAYCAFGLSGRYVRVFYITIILTLLVNTLCAQQNDDLKEVKSFGSNPGNLRMFLHAGTGKDSIAMPLIVVLHGCNQDAENVARLTGWNKLADENGLIVLYPEQRLANNPAYCFNWFNEEDINKGKGECESIWQMITYMRANYNIDSTKIIITGLSAGAAMSVVMMATHPGAFSYGAIFAGGAYKLETDRMDVLKAMAGKKNIPREELVKNIREQNPTYTGSYPKVIIYHGLDDHVVDPYNSKLLVDQWTGIHGCDTVPDKTDSAYHNMPDITRMEFLDNSGKACVIYYQVQNLGHQLLVKPGSKKDEGGRTGIYGVNRNFHSTWNVAREAGLVKE